MTAAALFATSVGTSDSSVLYVPRFLLPPSHFLSRFAITAPAAALYLPAAQLLGIKERGVTLHFWDSFITLNLTDF